MYRLAGEFASIQVQRCSLRPPVKIALLGGGRWGRVYAGILARLLGAGDRILWTSHYNYDLAAAHAARVSQTGGPKFELFDTLDAALAYDPSAAIVVNASHKHFASALHLIERNIPVLVEKPLALTELNAQALVDAALERTLVIGLSLPFLMASYLHRFSSMLRERNVAHVDIGWRDPLFEIRHGERKLADYSEHKLHDAYPHIWSVLRSLIPTEEIEPVDVHALENGVIYVDLRCANVTCRATQDRRATARERSISVTFTDGSIAKLDFTVEPGTIVLDGTCTSGDPDWEHAERPLSAQVRSFLAAIETKEAGVDWPLAARRCIGTVLGSVALAQRLRPKEMSMLVERLRRVSTIFYDPSVAAWLLDNLLPEFSAKGVRIAPDDDKHLLEVVGSALAALTDVMSQEDRYVKKPDTATRQALQTSDFLGELRRRLQNDMRQGQSAAPALK